MLTGLVRVGFDRAGQGGCLVLTGLVRVDVDWAGQGGC